MDFRICKKKCNKSIWARVIKFEPGWKELVSFCFFVRKMREKRSSISCKSYNQNGIIYNFHSLGHYVYVFKTIIYLSLIFVFKCKHAYVHRAGRSTVQLYQCFFFFLFFCFDVHKTQFYIPTFIYHWMWRSVFCTRNDVSKARYSINEISSLADIIVRTVL